MGTADWSWLRGDDDEVARGLKEEFDRVTGAAELCGVLGLGSSATMDEIRAAFLVATKRFHPNLFARRPPAIAQQAHELFLLINRAYRKLTAEPPPTSSPPARTQRRGQSINSTQRTAIPVSPAGEVLSRSAIAARHRGEGGDSAAPATPSEKVSTNISFNAPSGANRGKRSLAARRAARRRTDVPRNAGTTTPPLPASQALESQEVVVDRVTRREQQRRDEFRAAVEALDRADFSQAREAFKKLAVDNPSDKTYRVYMHYAWGCEYQANSEPSRAEAEYSRALKLDPAFELADKAVSALRAPTKKPRLLSKLFKRD